MPTNRFLFVSGGVGAGTEDTEDKLQGKGEAELVEGMLHIEITSHDVRHVVDRHEVLVSRSAGGGCC